MNIEKFKRVVALGIDIQNDFCPGGSLAVESGDQVVDVFNSISQWVRDNRGIVAYTRDWHPPQTSHFGNPPDFTNTWPLHCVADTIGAAFKDGLDVRDGDPILSKGMSADENAYSGFQAVEHSGLTLETLITPINHDKIALVIGGLATDYCVKATVLDALDASERFNGKPDRHLKVFAVTDAMRAVKAESGAQALDAMAKAGASLVTSHQILNGEVLRVEN